MTLILEGEDRVKQEGSLPRTVGALQHHRGPKKWPSNCDIMDLWADVVGVSAIV